jgi:hypothetical protein
MRDAGIDAMAALDHSLAQALEGLTDEQQQALKHTIGDLMVALGDALIRPAVAAYPALEPDAATWQAVVRTRAAERAAAQA